MLSVARSEAPKRLLTLGRRPQILLEEVQEVEILTINELTADAECGSKRSAKASSDARPEAANPP